MVGNRSDGAVSDPLESRDYRSLLSILEDVSGAGETMFFDRLRESLARNLGWTDVVIVDIPEKVAPFPAAATASGYIFTNRSSVFVDEYLDRWYLKNPFKTPGAGRLIVSNGAVTLADVRGHSTEAEWGFVGGYLVRHRIADLLHGCIDAGSAGSALVCRYVSDEAGIDERGRMLMRLLTRHLAPHLRDYFARSQETREGVVLTAREAEVVRLVAQGLSNSRIADELHIRVDTVKKHVMSAMRKTGTDNRTQLALVHLVRQSDFDL